MSHILKQEYNISRTSRNRLNGHNSFVVWLTGLSGSGKSTIANRLEEKLFNAGIRTYCLDGDNVRGGLNKGLTFSLGDRKENNRRTAEVAKLFVDAGVVTITAFISPLKEDRELAREIIGQKDFFEIFIDTPLEVCEERDVKGLYKKARSGEIKNFTGVTSPYEAPEHADLTINTTEFMVEDAADEIYNYLLEKLERK